jgi:hypothetical protein
MPDETTAQDAFGQPLMPLFLRWYFLQRPAQIVRLYGAYAKAFYNVFSFTFLLKTLVAPWKKISDEYPENGFNLRAVAETLFLNLTARGIGLIVRLGTMLIGVVVQIIIAVFFIAYFFVWLLFPLLAIAGVVYSFMSVF